MFICFGFFQIGALLASAIKSPNSQSSKGTVGLNSAANKKGLSPSLIPDSFDSEENEMKLSGGSMLSNFMNNGDKETLSGAITGSDCVEDTSTEYLVQPPSLVRSIDFAQHQNDIPLLAGNVVGSGNTLQLGGIGVAQGPSQEGKNDIPNSLEVISSVGNELSASLGK